MSANLNNSTLGLVIGRLRSLPPSVQSDKRKAFVDECCKLLDDSELGTIAHIAAFVVATRSKVWPLNQSRTVARQVDAHLTRGFAALERRIADTSIRWGQTGIGLRYEGCQLLQLHLRQAIPLDVKRRVLAAGLCAHCGSTDRLTVDHVRPVARGGSNDEANLQCLCRPCNSRKGARYAS